MMLRAMSGSRTMILAVVAALAGACGGGSSGVECKEDEDCNLEAGGRCAVYEPTGNKWCQYEDPSCPAGYRWSDFETGDGLSGECGPEDVRDAGADASADAPPDAEIDGGGGEATFAIGFGGVDNDYAFAYATAAGDAVLGGQIAGSVNLGGGDRPGAAFVARYNPEGLHRWSVGFAATRVEGVGIDSAGNVLVVGSFTGSFTWPGTVTTLTSLGGSDVFVAKLAANTGAHVWSIRAGGVGDDYAADLAVASNGDVVITGVFDGTSNFGGSNLVSGGGYDVFAARYASGNGAHVWSRSFSGGGNDFAEAVAIDVAGNVIVAGYFLTTITLAAVLTTAGGNDMFAAQLDGTTGATTWGQRYGGTGTDRAIEIATGPTATEVYLVGSFSNSFTFATAITSVGSEDVFVGRVDGSNGDPVWAAALGATNIDRASDATLDSDGSLLVTGIFRDTVSFGVDSLVSAGSDDVFVVDINTTTGAAIDARRFGGTGSDSSRRIGVSSAGTIDVAGSYFATVDFGIESLTSNGNTDMFLVRFAP